MDLLLPLPHIFIPFSLAPYVRTPVSQFNSWSIYAWPVTFRIPSQGFNNSTAMFGLPYLTAGVHNISHNGSCLVKSVSVLLCNVCLSFCIADQNPQNNALIKRHIYSSMNFTSRPSCLEHKLLVIKQFYVTRVTLQSGLRWDTVTVHIQPLLVPKVRTQPG